MVGNPYKTGVSQNYLIRSIQDYTGMPWTRLSSRLYLFWTGFRFVNSKLDPGYYEAEFDGTNYPSGIYFYTINAGHITQTKKMVLIK
jgi:hypothetical protein